MNAKNEAIATADAHLSNVGLPTYTQMEAALTRAAHMLTAVFEIANTLAEHPDANKGNSKVHYCRMRAIGALEKLNGDDVADLKALALKPTYQELADCVAELAPVATYMWLESAGQMSDHDRHHRLAITDRGDALADRVTRTR